MGNLALYEFVPDLYQTREVRILLLKHHEHHSSAGWRQGSRFLFAVVQAGPLKVRVADEMGLAVS